MTARNLVRIAGWLALAAPAWPDQGVLQLTLVEAQRQALARYLGLEAARRAVDAAAADQAQARSALLPQLAVSEQLVRSNDPVSAFGFRLRQERFGAADFAPDRLNRPAAITDYQTSLEAQQPLFTGGRNLARSRQAGHALQAARSELARSRQDVLLRTTQAYWDLALAVQVSQAVDQALETATAYRDAAAARGRADRALPADVLAAEVRVAELRGDRIEAVNRVLQAADHLTLLLGRDAGEPVVPVDSLSADTAWAGTGGALPAAMQARPDLRAAEERVAAADHGVRAARAQLLPRLDAFARLDLDADAFTARQGESWTVGAMARWTPGLGPVAAVAGARAEARRAQVARDLLRQQIERQVRQAERQVAAARTRIGIAAQAVAQAAERQRLCAARYREGAATVAELLEAQSQHTQAAVRQLQARRDLRVGLAELDFALAIPVP